MKLGELLMAAGLIDATQLAAALARQQHHGGRLGENLVAMNVLTPAAFAAFMHRVPREPDSLAATAVDDSVLLDLALKLIHRGRLETAPRLADAIGLPPHLALELMRRGVERQWLRAAGTQEGAASYALTEEGARHAREALQQSGYVGPAPVALADFIAMVEAQKIANIVVTADKIRAAFGALIVAERFVERLGPALNSGRALLLYGPPGNGKTSVAQRFASIFDDIVYIPYAVSIDGHIMRVYDPSVHVAQTVASVYERVGRSLLRAEEADARWVACRRPFLVAGGELTLEMLDLQFDPTTQFYEAPLHVKALGGCFVIDDFGRQLVSPTALLNRWIVPMESRVDYLKLRTGKSFAVPFEELLVFSTNLEPEELMDPAFLRRLPYKLEVGGPGRARYREIFAQACARQGLTLDDETFATIVQRVTVDKKLELAAYQPGFIVDQVVATCRFLGLPPRFEPRFIEYAVDNLKTHRQDTPSRA